MSRTVVVIAGATATGKTTLGESVARAIGGEIVCADARQLYRPLEIGTGKPTPAERSALPHHLFDRLELGETSNAGEWSRDAAEVCEALFARGVTPVLVGGSGLYLSALVRGLHDQPPRDPALRARLDAEAAESGSPALHAHLASLDPDAAAALSPRDRQRIVRAIEIVQTGGRPVASWREHRRAPALQADWRLFELTCPAAVLDRRVEQRTHEMFASGLIEETRALLERGEGEALRRLSAIGYDEAMALLAGKCTREEAEQRTSQRTRQLAKRQRTWFRHQFEATRLEGEPWDETRLVRSVLDLI